MKGRSLAVLLLAAALPAGVRAASQDFTLVNRTGYRIDKVYVTEPNNDSWGNDVLGSDRLEAGERAAITFDSNARQCRWNLRLLYHDATEAVLNGLNLCGVSEVTLFWDRGLARTIARVR